MGQDPTREVRHRLGLLRNELPDDEGRVPERFVRDYHAILDSLSALCDVALHPFRIAAHEIRTTPMHVLVSRPTPLSRDADRWCDRGLLMAKLRGAQRQLGM